MSVYKSLKYYYTVINRCTNKIVCYHCKVSMLPKLFEKHCSSRHDINGKTHCVWCRQFSWMSGEKKNHVNHLIECFKDFLKLKPFNKNDSIKSYRLLTMDHKHSEKDFYGHVLSDPELSSSQFDCICPLDVDSPPPIHFPDKNLNLAASYLRKYLETQNTHDWMHIMLRVGAFKSFVQAMDEDGGNSRMLEFSCWCDGGHFEEDKYRQHRHMIIVSYPKNHFRLNVWSKVRPENRPFPNFKCKELKKIEGPLHLVNSMGYLSQRKSRCNFSFDNNKKTLSQNKHFYLYKTLPKTHKLHLVQFWDGGIYKLLYVEKFQNVSISRLAQGKVFKLDGQWKQKMKDFYNHERGLVLNVSKGFSPINEITPLYFHLMNGEKLYFEFSRENETLDDGAWIRKQVMNGNCFYDIVEENIWTPRKSVQEVLNFHKPVLDRKNELEIENANLKNKLENEIKSKELKISELNDEIKSIFKSKELKIAELNDEIKAQDLKISELKDEIKSYIMQINELNNVKLKMENQKLKFENQRLKMKLLKFKTRFIH